MAIAGVESFINMTIEAYKLIGKKGKIKAVDTFYEGLPEEFETSRAQEIGQKLGMHEKTVRNKLKSYIQKEKLTRVRHGHYSKKVKKVT